MVFLNCSLSYQSDPIVFNQLPLEGGVYFLVGFLCIINNRTLFVSCLVRRTRSGRATKKVAASPVKKTPVKKIATRANRSLRGKAQDAEEVEVIFQTLFLLFLITNCREFFLKHSLQVSKTCYQFQNYIFLASNFIYFLFSLS